MTENTYEITPGKNKLTKSQLLWRIIYATPIVLVFLIVYILSTTNPSTSGVGGILAIFALLYLFFLNLSYILVHVGVIVMRKARLTKGKIGNRKAYYLATVIALLPVFLLALNSIGQLRILDVILVTSFVVIACFYVTRRSNSNS